MSGYINSLLIEPVMRQARRFSYSGTDEGPSTPLSHATDPDASPDASEDATRDPDVHTQPDDQLRADEAPLENPASISSLSLRTSIGDGHYHVTIPHHPDNSSSYAQGVSSHQASNESPSRTSSDEEDRAAPQSLRTSQESLSSRRLNRDSTSVLHGPRGDDPGASTQSARRRSSVEMGSRDRNLVGSREGNVARKHLSRDLPEDDGMKPLREKMKLIQEMALSSEEKARRMHALMVADYEAFKASTESAEASSKRSSNNLSVGAQHSRITSLDADSQRSPTPMSTTSVGDVEDTLLVSAEDRKPTYKPRSASSSTAEATGVDEDEEEPYLGCIHYLRNVKIQCGDCKRWYTCRHCHDDSEGHRLNRKSIKNMLCMLCGHAQKAGAYCEKCGDAAAAYYCEVCQLWESDPNKRIYHCVDCGICRRGEGLGKDFVHCKRCNVCISIAWITDHRCVERATECDCPICNDWMFTSSAAVVAMRCGHYIHRKCYDEYMNTSYKCPICNRSAVNMELQWRKLDQAIAAQPMPRQFAETKALVGCNDCGSRTCTNYHWLGNKCTACDSYNTNYIKLVNGPAPEDVEAMAAIEDTRIAQAPEGPNIDTEGRTNRPGGVPVVIPAIPARLRDPTVTHSANSSLATQQTRPRSAEVQASHLSLPESPPNTTARHGPSPSSPPFTDPGRRRVIADEGGSQTDSDVDLEDEDDVGFWGEGISPSSWSLPMGISPMSGWASPSFFATTMESRARRANENDADEGEDDEGDEDGEWSSDDSDDEEEPVEVDEDGDVEDIELLGHR